VRDWIGSQKAIPEARAASAEIVELKIDFGAGYRVCYTMRGDVAVLLL